MNNHEAVIKGIIPAHTREEKDALIEHLRGEIERLTAETNRLAHESDLRASERDKAEAGLVIAADALKWFAQFKRDSAYTFTFGEIGDIASTALAKIRGEG